MWAMCGQCVGNVWAMCGQCVGNVSGVDPPKMVAGGSGEPPPYYPSREHGPLCRQRGHGVRFERARRTLGNKCKSHDTSRPAELRSHTVRETPEMGEGKEQRKGEERERRAGPRTCYGSRFVGDQGLVQSKGHETSGPAKLRHYKNQLRREKRKEQ